MHGKSHTLLCAVGALGLVGSLAGCGGGGGASSGGGAVAVTPTPTPTPAPTPTPTPTPTPLAGPVAIATVGEFAVLGHETSYTVTSGANDRQDFAETFEGTRFRYLANGVHELLLPLFEWSPLGSSFAFSRDFVSLAVSEPGGTGKGFNLTLLRPDAAELPLSYSGFGTWYLNQQVLTSSGRQLQISGNFAYGVATPGGGLPASGSATYRGFGDFDGYATPSPIVASVDFASGRVQGTITPTYNDGIGGISDAGALPFSGTLPSGATLVSLAVSLPGGQVGTLEVQFAGHAGEELIFRFRGPIKDPFSLSGTIAAVGVGAARLAS